ncbi:magnesium transporter CorA [Sporolactobacillus sp. THM7-4]|nr:magnesium transporter CorA [Sporolactobacillus sp. THM7-4]
MLKKYENKDYQWIWYRLESWDETEIKQIIDQNKECRDWLKNIEKNHTNKITVNTTQYDQPFVNGSLIYMQNTINREENDIFHYYITEHTLLTVDLDFSRLKNTEIKKIVEQMDRSKNAIDAFFIILGALTTNYLEKISDFEIKMNEMIWDIKKRNNTSTLDKIYDRRHELSICRNLMIPVREILLGLEEAFGEEILQYPQVKQKTIKIKRCLMLLKEYQHEIDTLIDVEAVVSSHRGNEIMKTLTVITVLFTPIACWSALWGMNFPNMPWLSWRYGFIAALTVIIVNTILLYLYLYRKGWTGDILKTREKHSMFK